MKQTRWALVALMVGTALLGAQGTATPAEASTSYWRDAMGAGMSQLRQRALDCIIGNVAAHELGAQYMLSQGPVLRTQCLHALTQLRAWQPRVLTTGPEGAVEGVHVKAELLNLKSAWLKSLEPATCRFRSRTHGDCYSAMMRADGAEWALEQRYAREWDLVWKRGAYRAPWE